MKTSIAILILAALALTACTSAKDRKEMRAMQIAGFREDCLALGYREQTRLVDCIRSMDQEDKAERARSSQELRDQIQSFGTTFDQFNAVR